MIKAIIFLLLGFVFLVKGADFFVDGSSSVAKRLRVPSLVIGLTVVAMGTSLPELSVSAVASLNGSNSLAVSNVIGSNLFNLLVVLGFTSVITPIAVSRDAYKRDLPVSIICSVFLLISGVVFGGITRWIAITFLVAFAYYMISIVVKSLKNRGEVPEEEIKGISIPLSLIYIVGGAVAIKFGGDWVVDSATTIALFFGISETLIGLTIVALGTSLPELVTGLVAAKKGEVEMAVGNAVGSNIFNVLLILGVAGAISPISVITENIIDAGVLIVSSVIVLIFCISRQKIEKKEGAIMLLIYAAYLAYIIVR